MPAAPVASVAAGDRSTANVGAQVLRAGGSATDAAVAAMLAACAAETVMTGLGGGGFATVWDSDSGTATTVDFFVNVPGIGLDRPVSKMSEISVIFGPQRLEYYVGAASAAVPGVTFGLTELHRRWGVLPWADIVTPAFELARNGSPISATKAAVLADIREGMLNSPEGRAAYAPTGQLIQAGERLFHDGLAAAYALLRDVGDAAFRSSGAVGAATVAMSAERGGLLTAADLDAYQVLVSPARRESFAGAAVHGRTDLLDLLGTLSRLPADLGSLTAGERAIAWVEALLGPEKPFGTTNLCAVDGRGNACAITTSLGLGAGDWVPGFGIHLNSMLGEGELMVDYLRPGDRMPSMMCPLVVTRPEPDAEGGVDGDLLVLVAGAAGGSRIRSGLVQTMTGVLAEGLTAQEAVTRGRINPVRTERGVLVHCEPDVPPDVVRALADRGYEVSQWESTSAYFGGVSMIGRSGAAADHRRDGHVAYS